MMFFNDKIIMGLSFTLLIAVALVAQASEPADVDVAGVLQCPAKICTAITASVYISLDEFQKQERGESWFPVLSSSEQTLPKYSHYSPLLVVGADQFDHQVSDLLPVFSPEIWL